MTRKTPDPTPRLKSLTAARARVQTGETVNAYTLEQVAGLGWRSIKPMIDDDPEFPVLRRGSEGVAWEFDAAAVLDHMIARLNEQLAERRKREERVAELAGLTAEAVEGLTVTDLAKIDQLQTNAQRRKIEQREYVKRIDAEAVIAGIFTTVQSESLATVSRLDPAGRWPAGARAEMQDAMRTMLVRLHDQLGGWLRDDVAPPAKSRRRARAA